MTVMTKRGSEDNVVTYEHYCDTADDMASIDPKYITLGSICVVVQGSNGIDVYIAGSDKQWSLL